MKIAKASVKMALRALGYGVLGGFVTLVVVAIVLLEKRPDLSIWHEAKLDEEFTRHSDVEDFAGYLALEDRLFKQLEREVYEKTGRAGENSINRYQHGSITEPAVWKRNWNRTFEFNAEKPKAGVLLLHGMSDSPYSLRAIGETLHQRGATVVGLRIPGHGTAPSGLVRVHWKDMAAAVLLAARHLREEIGDAPLYLIGYSNGGALAVEYALEAQENAEMPRVAGLVLISPEIGVTPAAALAVWQGRLGRWFGFHKLAWNSIKLEYDPYKYGSFAVNAGDQAYRVTKEIGERIDKLGKKGKLAGFPSVLAFQSGVDATVSVPALVSNLFAKLPEGGHELVLFDINRKSEMIESVLTRDPDGELSALLENMHPTFALSVVRNRSENGQPVAEIEIRRHSADGESSVEVPGLSWPEGIFSLSHVALPFPESDLLYGSGKIKDAGSPRLTLGNLALRGERGALRVSPDDMLRLRWNPFYSLIEKQTLRFLGLGTGGPPAPEGVGSFQSLPKCPDSR